MSLLKHKMRLKLIGVLGTIHIFNNEDGRNFLLGGLPNSLIAQIPRSNAPMIDLANIISTCNDWPFDPESLAATSEESHPLVLIIENARILTTEDKIRDDELRKIVDTIPLPPRIFPLSEDQRASTEINQARSEQLKSAYGSFLVELDDMNEPELLDKARELRRALQAEEPDIVYIENLYRQFNSIPNVQQAVRNFFKASIIRKTLIEALYIEHSWK